MRSITLNYCTRSYLNKTQRPIHYYARCLKYASDGIKELLYDSLRITNIVRIPVNGFYEVQLPDDFIDWVAVGLQVGQWKRPLIMKNSLNQLPNWDTATGTQINYPSPEIADQFWWGEINWWGVNINTNGEDTGGYYGIGAGSEPDTFTIDFKNNVIRLNQCIKDSKIILEYVGDGSFCNSASQITPYAESTINAYIDWQYKLNSKSYGMGDASQAERIFYNELRKLRARNNDLNPDQVERIINRWRKASLK
jgi:hypothetical protein